ncbi:unnamed protein product [Cyprideis torosa]|uniref:receptor protein-tyrosine kinase n=1 Tax=Cyprideis torosa TaxID=163714 RepID=A0A7R8WH40_9CRUS|nr:unnamed protein product [Cyprideis torosa]CAG0892811.1 unnamed protein product [Cyprideis torosa]
MSLSYFDDEAEDSELLIPPPVIGYCAPYNGDICRRILNSTGLVWYNASVESGEGLLNEQVATNVWVELISALQEPCRSAAEVMLCNYAFPLCDYAGSYPVGLPLCYEDCVAVRDSFCHNEWVLVEENKRRGRYVKSRAHFRLPVCEDLPSLRGNAEGAKCTETGLTSFRKELATTECIRGRGRYYQGRQNVSQSGLPCQPWDQQTPHRHQRPPPVFPELDKAENHCRNAGAEELKPWCYTTDPEVRWETCDIPYCDNEVPPLPSDVYYPIGRGVLIDPPTTPPTSSDDLLSSLLDLPPSLALAGGVALVSLLLVCCLLCLCCLRSRKTRNKRGPKGQIGGAVPDLTELEKLPANTSYHYAGARLNPKLEALEYPRNDIIYIRDLGQGMFGRVFQARAPALVDVEEFTIVAVKALKEEATPDLVANFEKEACLLAEFDHPNIVRLLGVCAIGRPMCLLFEYMGRGDLNRFLRASAPTNYVIRSTDGSSFSEACLTVPDKIFIAKQVAAGMVYLSDRGFVHRDLATRNCLVSDHMEVKISDFGLSQRLPFENASYKGRPEDAIPVRWMPLESITTNEFTLKSDVWAFGICLWEIFTFALQPYYGMSHEEVINFLRNGSRLAPPENCPPPVYELMRKCWLQNPQERPGFKVIFGTLELIQEQIERAVMAAAQCGPQPRYAPVLGPNGEQVILYA